MENQMLTELSTKLQHLLYFSESEAPLLLENLGQIPKDQLNAKIAELNNADIKYFVPITPDEFFEKIEKSADPYDEVIVANARKFKQLYTYLKNNTSDIQVIRIENGVKVPIVITAFLPDQSCITLSTYSIET